jgi:hypothetical protein
MPDGTRGETRQQRYILGNWDGTRFRYILCNMGTGLKSDSTIHGTGLEFVRSTLQHAGHSGKGYFTGWILKHIGVT